MKEKLLQYLLFLIALVLWPMPVSAQPAAPETPDTMMRVLQSLQDDVAAGQPDILERHTRALADFGTKLRETDLSAFKDNRNIYALIAYFFNGGNPAIVESILENIPEQQVPQNLVKNMLAYMHGRKSELLNAFTPFVPENTDWPAMVRLSIYLNIVADMAEKDPAAASECLDYVRLAAPGSLFEEAAIRRQLKISAQLGDIKKIRLLTHNYAGRFSASPYADSFWNELTEILPLINSRLTDADFDELVCLAPVQAQYLIYLYTARAALIDGHMERAFYSASHAGRLALALKINDTTVRLYYAASQAGSPEAPAAAKILQSIQASDLDARDHPLLDAAQKVAQSVIYYPENTVKTPQQKSSNGSDHDTQWPDHIPEPAAGLRFLSTPPRQERADGTEIDDFLEKARKKLDAVDQLLKEQGA